MASHRLGNIYEAVGDPEVATMYHKGELNPGILAKSVLRNQSQFLCLFRYIPDYLIVSLFPLGYLDRCKRDKDKVGMGKAYEALARCQQSEGKLDEAVENYKEFVAIAEEVGEKSVISQACSSLANLYNMLVSRPKRGGTRLCESRGHIH